MWSCDEYTRQFTYQPVKRWALSGMSNFFIQRVNWGTNYAWFTSNSQTIYVSVVRGSKQCILMITHAGLQKKCDTIDFQHKIITENVN